MFAGAGGLSYGFLQTGKFEVKLAVEINKHAQETYKANHKNNDIEIKSNINDVNFLDIKNKYGSIDFVIGGSPCQGFSNVNRQRNTLIRHAEEGVLNEFNDEIKKKGIDPKDVKGNLYIHQSNPRGVCNKCSKGLIKSFPKSNVVYFIRLAKNTLI